MNNQIEVPQFTLKKQDMLRVRNHCNKPRTINKGFNIKVSRCAENINDRTALIKAEVKRQENLKKKISDKDFIANLNAIDDSLGVDEVNTEMLIDSLSFDIAA